MKRLSLVLASSICLIVSLSACEQDETPMQPETTDTTPVEDNDGDRYRKKVEKKVSASVVRSFAREWGVSEASVECLLEHIDVTKFDDADSDPAVAAVFERCGVTVAN